MTDGAFAGDLGHAPPTRRHLDGPTARNRFRDASGRAAHQHGGDAWTPAAKTQVPMKAGRLRLTCIQM
jgi:hypothetical protein